MNYTIKRRKQDTIYVPQWSCASTSSSVDLLPKFTWNVTVSIKIARAIHFLSNLQILNYTWFRRWMPNMELRVYLLKWNKYDWHKYTYITWADLILLLLIFGEPTFSFHMWLDSISSIFITHCSQVQRIDASYSLITNIWSIYEIRYRCLFKWDVCTLQIDSCHHQGNKSYRIMDNEKLSWPTLYTAI